MQSGRVRAILLQHAQGAHAAHDPAAFVPESDLTATLQGRSPDQQRQTAHDYIALWARTFPTLVRHLRGRPEHALRLWCHEVYPYLRGERLAARVEHSRPGGTEVLLTGDLPPAYIGGLLEAFVGLSRAECRAEHAGGGTFTLRFRIHPTDRLASAVQSLADLRVPLLLTAVLAGLVGTALATRSTFPWWHAAILLFAVLSAQAAANALQALRRRGAGPLEVHGPPSWHWSTLLGGYATASAAGAFFFLLGRPLVVPIATAGLLLSLAYPFLRDRGLGPLLAGLVHGPLIVTGSLYALTGDLGGWTWLETLVASLPVGAFTTAILYLDDVADRPLDQASGRRTLAVRLPLRRHLVGFVALLATGIAAATLLAFQRNVVAGSTMMLLTLPLAWTLVRTVQVHQDDPRNLAGARVGTIALHAITTVALSLTLLEPLP